MFSIATVTNCDKLKALKQHIFIIFQFYILGVQHGLHQAKTKVSDGLFSILLTLGESSLPFPTSKGHSQYLAHGPLSPFSKLSQWHLSLIFSYTVKKLFLWLNTSGMVLYFKDSSDYTGSVSVSVTLIPSVKFLFPCKVTHSLIPGVKVRISRNHHEDYPSGTVGKNPPTSAEDTDSTLVWELRSHMFPTTIEPNHQEPVLCNKRSHHNEKSRTTTREQPPLVVTTESTHKAMKTQHRQK